MFWLTRDCSKGGKGHMVMTKHLSWDAWHLHKEEEIVVSKGWWCEPKQNSPHVCFCTLPTFPPSFHLLLLSNLFRLGKKTFAPIAIAWCAMALSWLPLLHQPPHPNPNP